MRNLFWLLLLPTLLVFHSSQAQTTAGNELVISTPISASGTTVNALLKLPDDYSSTSTKYPIVIFLHGTGEAGTNLASIYTNSGSGGPAYFIANSQWPASFINPVDGNAYKFIVLSPQAATFSTSGTQLNYIINYMLSNYRVDTNRIYLTGLSAGGQGIFDYTTHNGVTPLHKSAAIVPMSMAVGVPTQNQINTTIADSIHVWGFGSETDVMGINTHIFVTGAYNGNGGSLTGLGNLGQFTSYTGGHCCWNTFYNPTYTQLINGSQINIYQWLLQFSRTGNVTNLPPTANAGPDQNLTLPVTVTNLSGSGSDVDGTISSYSWSFISGPTTPVIASPSNATTSVSGLAIGTYFFRLTVTDNAGATAIDDVKIIVAPNNASAGFKNIIKVGGGEYFTSFLTDENKIYATLWNGTNNTFTPFSLTNVIDVDGAQYSNIVLLGDGTVRVIKKASSGGELIIPVPTDSLGNVFDGNTKVYGWYEGYLSIRHDSVYYWGKDNLQINGSGSNLITSPIKLLQPPGRIVTKIVVSDINPDWPSPLTVLCSDGTVWHYTKGNRNPIQKNIAAPVLDITSIGRACYIALTANDLFAWGPYTAYVGLNDYVTTPTSILNKFTSIGLVTPIREVVGNWNTLHIIDANNNMFACGDNEEGEIGNGREEPNWVNYTYNSTPSPFGWSWLRGQLMQAPVQIPGKFHNVCTSNSIAFYLYAQDCSNNWYSWGRNKMYALGNGQRVSNDNIYPNWGDVPAPTFVSPSTINWGPELPFNASSMLAPVAHAGTGQCISNTNSTTLSASGSFQQSGTITTYTWSLINGTACNIVSPNSVSTSVTGLTTGLYVFRVTVTNNSGISSYNDVRINVNAAPNLPPISNAGPDKSITLPINSVTLSGSGTDPDGTITVFQWSKIAGPSTYTILSPSAPSTNINNLVQGVYQFQLTVTDNLGAIANDTVVVTVNPAPNLPPVANAGTDKAITLPTNSVTLTGTGTDPDGTISAYQWTKIAGPATFTIVSPTAATTVINGLVQGTYQFELKVTDNQGATGKDTVNVTVNPAPNIPPVANAGADQSIQLPVNTVNVNGTASDPDGTIASYQWTRVSGPLTYTIASPAAASTAINGLVQGVYQFEFKVTDNAGAIARDTVQITVNPANLPPVVNAGPDQTIQLPVNTVTVNGSGTDPDGTIAAYQWTKITGPGTFTIVNPTSANTAINGLIQGTYQFELKVTDNLGATGKDTLVVTVNPANIPPVANAGPDKNITLPTNTVTLTGTGTDPDGTIAAYQWSKIAGPATYTIVTPTQGQTIINNLVQGVYQFELRVTDNQGATGKDTVFVIVNPAANINPTAYAGSDQTIILPVNSVTLSGSGIDPDGTIASYQWNKISGPATYSIVSPSSASTVINNLVQGIYQFELVVTDNQGATGKDTVYVTVNPANNLPPAANAGADQSITLPINSVTLNGSGSDPDGTIASYQWSRISGPAAYAIVSPASASTMINNLVQGIYLFELTVTDNAGAIARDTVTVTVNPAVINNQPPSANAGLDQNIMLPVSTVTLNGSGTDPDGTIVSYQWVKISGPATFTIVNPASASTVINNLVQGIYQFELTVTDNAGASARDTVYVIVNPATQLPNIPPLVQAGTDQYITLPVSYIATQAAASDPDGIITNYQWTKIGGPLVYTIVSPTQAQTEIRDLIPGHYSFELKVTDNRGAVARDTMYVDVADAPMVYGNVFPNPATNQVNVSVNAAVTTEKTIITIFDVRGQPMVREEFTRSSQNTVRRYDVTKWVKGYYLVEIRLTENVREVKRFVVQ